MTDESGEEHWIEAIGYEGLSQAVEAHRYDPDVDLWEVDDPDNDLATTIRGADTLEELKSALLGENENAKARG